MSEQARTKADEALGIYMDPTGTTNQYHRLDPTQDYIISVAEKVYGVFNDTQNTIGYDKNNHITILANGIISMATDDMKLTPKTLDIHTNAYGFKWQDLSLNPELLSTSLVYMSDNLIGDILNIINNTTGLTPVSPNDVRRVNVFTTEDIETKADKLERNYPIVSGLSWRNDLQLNSRNDLSYTPALPSEVPVSLGVA